MIHKLIQSLAIIALSTSLTTSMLATEDSIELIRNGDFSSTSIEPWKPILLDGAAGTFQVVTEGPENKPVALINITTASNEGKGWATGMAQPISLSKDKKYRLTFRIKGNNTPPTMLVIIGSNYPPFSPIPGVRAVGVVVTKDWQNITFNFTPTVDEPKARIVFSDFNKAGANLYLSNISLLELPAQ